MKKTLLFSIVLSILLLSNIVFAEDNEINYFAIENVISPGNSIKTSISITLEEPVSNSITIKIFDKFKNLEKDANFPNFSCIEEEKTYGTEIICDISGYEKYNKTLKLTYEHTNSVNKIDDKFLFQQEVETPSSTTNFFAKIILPEGMGLIEGEDFLPQTGEITSDGRKVSIYWRENNLKNGNLYSFKVSFERIIEELDIFMLVIPFIILIGVLVYLFIKEKRIPKRIFRKKIKVVLPVLKSDEKKVVESILKNGDGVNQKIVVEESGYSKAKVSKVLKSLMERDIISLKRIGRKNEVFINSKFKKTI